MKKESRFKWFNEATIPSKARVIETRDIIIHYEENSHDLMPLVPVYEKQYLVDLNELRSLNDKNFYK